VAAVAEKADCHLLLDVNNVYVNARNHWINHLAHTDIDLAFRGWRSLRCERRLNRRRHG
jgi:hypothetical protein